MDTANTVKTVTWLVLPLTEDHSKDTEVKKMAHAWIVGLYFFFFIAAKSTLRTGKLNNANYIYFNSVSIVDPRMLKFSPFSLFT